VQEISAHRRSSYAHRTTLADRRWPQYRPKSIDQLPADLDTRAPWVCGHFLEPTPGLEPVASPTCSQTGSSLIENIKYNNQDVSSKPGAVQPGSGHGAAAPALRQAEAEVRAPATRNPTRPVVRGCSTNSLTSGPRAKDKPASRDLGRRSGTLADAGPGSSNRRVASTPPQSRHSAPARRRLPLRWIAEVTPGLPCQYRNVPVAERHDAMRRSPTHAGPLAAVECKIDRPQACYVMLD